MALSYGLELEARLEPAEILHMIADNLALEWHQGILRGPGITVNVYKPDESDISVIESEFPAWCLHWISDKSQ